MIQFSPVASPSTAPVPARDPLPPAQAQALAPVPLAPTQRPDAVRQGDAPSRSAEALFHAMMAGAADDSPLVGPPPAFDVSVLDDLRRSQREASRARSEPGIGALLTVGGDRWQDAGVPPPLQGDDHGAGPESRFATLAQGQDDGDAGDTRSDPGLNHASGGVAAPPDAHGAPGQKSASSAPSAAALAVGAAGGVAAASAPTLGGDPRARMPAELDLTL